MHLNYSSHRQRAHLDKANSSEVRRHENVYVALVAEENIGLVLQCISVDRPEPITQPVVLQGSAVVRVVYVVIVDRRQTHEEDGASNERPRPIYPSKQFLGVQGMALDRKTLVLCQLLPSEIARLGKCTHLVRC